MNEIKYVCVKESERERKLKGSVLSNWRYSFWQTGSERVYFEGRIYDVIFHLKNDETVTTHFGWAFQEKKKERVEEVEKKLFGFIEGINEVISKLRK